MSVWDSCTGCDITIPIGEKGDPGDATTGVITANSANLVLAAVDTGSTVFLSRTSGVTITLPSAPDVGTFFDFEVLVAATTGSYIINTNGTDVYDGYLFGMKATTAPERFVANAALTDVRITLNGTTSGGLIGTTFRMIYNSASNNTWAVSGHTYGSGSLVTSFS